MHCVWTAPTSATSSFCRPATPRSPGAPRKPADCPPSWCAGAHDAIVMSGKASWRRRPRSNRPHKSASPTPTCAPAAGHASRAAGPIRTCASAVSSPPLSVSSSRVVRSTAPRRSHFTPRRAAAAVWDEAPPGEALDPDAVRLAVVASVRHVDTDYDALLMSGVDRESARAQVHQRVEDVVNAWRDGVAMLDE